VNRRQVLWLVGLAAVAFWLWKSGTISRESSPSPAPASAAGTSGAAPGAAGFGCLTAAETAGRETQEAAMVLLRTPIDPAAFSAASERASSTISAAEGKCGGGGSSNEQRAMEEARGALSEMRALLSDLSGTLSGGGSASEVPRRREAVDVHLAAARAALQS
jgi:hypothetical protein